MNQTERILVVDDEDPVRFFLSEVLSNHGYEVNSASCGTHALERAREAPPDLILLDYKMNDMDGIEVLRRMRSQGVKSAVILLTAYGTLDTAIDLMRNDGFDFLKKPCSNEDLLACVDRALVHHRTEQQREQMAQLMEMTLRQAQLLEAFAPPRPNMDRFLELDGLLLDRQLEMVRRDGTELPLTRTEFRLLACLMENADHPISYTELYKAVYGLEASEQERLEARQALSTHLWRLRQKLGNDHNGRPYIVNVHGGSYRFVTRHR